MSGSPAYPTSVALVRTDVHDNSAETGGGIWLQASASADAESRIHDNDADYGAGVALRAGVPGFDIATWTGATIDSNSAVLGGGGIYLDTRVGVGAAVEVNGTVVRDNNAADGGGIYIEGEEIHPDAVAGLRVVEISGNVATGNGGGIWIDHVWVTIGDSSVTDNAARSGGGAYLSATATLDATSTGFAGNQPVDLLLEGGTTYDAADVAATFTCTGADAICQ